MTERLTTLDKHSALLDAIFLGSLLHPSHFLAMFFLARSFPCFGILFGFFFQPFMFSGSCSRHPFGANDNADLIGLDWTENFPLLAVGLHRTNWIWKTGLSRSPPPLSTRDNDTEIVTHTDNHLEATSSGPTHEHRIHAHGLEHLLSFERHSMGAPLPLHICWVMGYSALFRNLVTQRHFYFLEFLFIWGAQRVRDS